MFFCVSTIGLGKEFRRERGNEVTWKKSKVDFFFFLLLGGFFWKGVRMNKENNRITET